MTRPQYGKPAGGQLFTIWEPRRLRIRWQVVRRVLFEHPDGNRGWVREYP